MSVKKSRIALAFVGSVVPDEPEFRNSALSAAGQMYQRELLLSLKNAGLEPSAVLSVTPMPAFPRSRRIWIKGGVGSLLGKIRIVRLPFINVTPIKQITLGLGTFVGLLLWGLRTFRTRHRVVVTYNLTVPPGLLTFIAARLIRAKAVALLCDINVPGQTVPSNLSTRIDFRLHKFLIPKFDGHVVAADRMMRDFAPGKHFLRLEGGVNREVARLSSQGLTRETEFVMVAAGSLHRANGILLMLEAFVLLPGSRFKLIVAGAGPLTEDVRRAAARDSRIQYLGKIAFSEVLKLYSTADLLLNIRLTKALETGYFFPSKVMECLASGTPVLSTCTGHMEQEYGEYAYFLREEDPVCLAQTIESIAAMPALTRLALGSKARDFMLSNKTWNAQGQNVLRFITERVLDLDPSALEHQLNDSASTLASLRFPEC